MASRVAATAGATVPGVAAVAPKAAAAVAPAAVAVVGFWASVHRYFLYDSIFSIQILYSLTNYLFFDMHLI